MSAYLSVALAVYLKDVRLEARSKETVGAVLIFALLVAFIFLFMGVIFVLVVDLEHVSDMVVGIASFGTIPEGMALPLLLGALAFAGAGGTMNLAQSNYIREKGYAMGRYAGRRTSPSTGRSRLDPSSSMG